MNGAFYVGATGLQAHQASLDLLAQNLANLNSIAFKRSEVRFSELISLDTRPTDSPDIPPQLIENPSGVRFYSSGPIFEQGPLRTTGNAFDIAVEGDGFIELLGPAGQTYLWRGGPVKIGSDGTLQTETGLTLKALIQVPETMQAMRIERDGRVLASEGSETDFSELGKIDLVMPDDPRSMARLDGGLYQLADSQDVRVLTENDGGAGVIVQGSLEGSNVDLSAETVTLLLMQRSYAANAQVVQAGDQLMSIANDLRR